MNNKSKPGKSSSPRTSCPNVPHYCTRFTSPSPNCCIPPQYYSTTPQLHIPPPPTLAMHTPPEMARHLGHLHSAADQSQPFPCFRPSLPPPPSVGSHHTHDSCDSSTDTESDHASDAPIADTTDENALPAPSLKADDAERSNTRPASVDGTVASAGASTRDSHAQETSRSPVESPASPITGSCYKSSNPAGSATSHATADKTRAPTGLRDMPEADPAAVLADKRPSKVDAGGRTEYKRRASWSTQYTANNPPDSSASPPRAVHASSNSSVHAGAASIAIPTQTADGQLLGYGPIVECGACAGYVSVSFHCVYHVCHKNVVIVWMAVV